MRPEGAALDGQLHPDGRGVPAAGDDAAERRPRCCPGIDMKRLRIVFACEADDRVFGEGVAAEFLPLADHNIFPMRAHGCPRLWMIGVVTMRVTCSRWLNRIHNIFTKPTGRCGCGVT